MCELDALRYGDFTTITRQRTFQAPSDGDQAIYDTAHALLVTAMRQRGDPIRLIGVAVNGLGEQAAQLSLLDVNPMIDSCTKSSVSRPRLVYFFTTLSAKRKFALIILSRAF